MVPRLVSTIIPVYNRPAQLAEAIESVLEQDYRPLEVIVIDDGSTDETLDVARAFAGRHPAEVRVFSQENAGPGIAREYGRGAAQGEFIQYLDSDDVLLPGKFSAQVALLEAMPDRGVAYGKTRFRHAEGAVEPHPWKESGIVRDTMFPSFLVSRWWDTPNPLYRSSVCEDAGSWTNLRLEEDWEYDCRIAALGTRLAWCDRYVCEVRDHADSKLGRGPALDPERLRHRSRSHALILGHALRAGVSSDSPEMQHFARALFLLARQCGAAGLPEESRRLFDLARQASGTERSRQLDFRGYSAAAAVIGWVNAGRLSCWMDRARLRK